MANNQNITGVSVDSSADDGKYVKYDGTTDTLVMGTPAGGSADMGVYAIANQDYGTNAYTLWATTPTISVGTAPTMDANGSLLLNTDTTWEISVNFWPESGASSGEYVSLVPFITNTSTGTSQSTSGSAVVTPNYWTSTYPPSAGVDVTARPYMCSFTQVIKVGSVAKYLRFDGQSSSNASNSNYQSLTVKKIA